MIPVHIDKCCGWFHPAAGKRAVLMCSPLGYEELGSRRGWKVMADKLAAAGLPTLRFDYPGTADSFGDANDPDQVASCIVSIQNAVAWLKDQLDVDQVVVIGLRMGATLAAMACENISGIHSLVLMAPVQSGRSFCREMLMLSRMLLESQGHSVVDEPQSNGVRVGGFRLSHATVKDIESLKLSQVLKKPAERVLVLRPAGMNTTAIEEQFSTLGSVIEIAEFDEYHSFVCDPIQSRPPVQATARIVDWLSADLSIGSTARAIPQAKALTGPEWTEEAVSFGPEGQLFGILCRPRAAQANHPVALFVNAGMSYHIGWGRITVELARDLAKQGITSLRMDLDGIGESGASYIEPCDILYADKPIASISAALDCLESLGFGNPAVIGSCSGAYAAYQTNIGDDRISTAVLINLYCFNWDSSVPLEEGLRRVQAPAQYVRRISSAYTLRRILSGDLKTARNVVWHGREIIGRAARRLAQKANTKLPIAQARKNIYRMLANGRRVAFIYSEGDAGYSNFVEHFGTDIRTSRFANLTCDLIPATDHDMSDGIAREQLTAILVRHLNSTQTAIAHYSRKT
jgi:pimeloyl-ACP methyl ester carboxylesterase